MHKSNRRLLTFIPLIHSLVNFFVLAHSRPRFFLLLSAQDANALRSFTFDLGTFSLSNAYRLSVSHSLHLEVGYGNFIACLAATPSGGFPCLSMQFANECASARRLSFTGAWMCYFAEDGPTCLCAALKCMHFKECGQFSCMYRYC